MLNAKELMLLNFGVGEDSWEFLGKQEIKPVNPKGNQSWIFIGRIDAEADAAILWRPDGKSQLLRKDPDAGKDWRQEEKGIAEEKMAGWHHLLNEDEFEQAPGFGEGQGSLACCSLWSHKELDTTEWLNRSELNWTYIILRWSSGLGLQTSHDRYPCFLVQPVHCWEM